MYVETAAAAEKHLMFYVVQPQIEYKFKLRFGIAVVGGYLGSVTDIGTECGINESCSNCVRAFCDLLNTNDLGKGINTSLLSHQHRVKQHGKLKFINLGSYQSKRWKTEFQTETVLPCSPKMQSRSQIIKKLDSGEPLSSIS